MTLSERDNLQCGDTRCSICRVCDCTVYHPIYWQLVCIVSPLFVFTENAAYSSELSSRTSSRAMVSCVCQKLMGRSGEEV